MANPTQEHQCEARCQLCGQGHFTGDRRCKAKYKIPYLVRRRRWERRRREEAEAETPYGINDYNKRAGKATSENTQGSEGQRTEGSPPRPYEGNSQEKPGRRPRSKTRSRTRSRTRSKTRSRTRSRSTATSRLQSTQGEVQPQAQVSFADVSGTAVTPTRAGSALEQEITQIRQLLEQITRENATLREEVKMLKVENAKLKNQKHSEMTHTTPTPIRASTPLRAPATPVPASMSAETPPHKRRAKENADEQTDSTLGEVKGMFQEMSVGLQQQFTQMRADR